MARRAHRLRCGKLGAYAAGEPLSSALAPPVRPMLRTEIYVQISPNAFSVRDLSSGRSARANSEAHFTTTRLLVGNFSAAQQALAKVLAEVVSSSLFRSMHFLMHPLALVEGGLSQVEERVLSELAEACGASSSAVWLGASLSDAEVSAKLKKNRRGGEETAG